jgi:choline dehydrogenase
MFGGIHRRFFLQLLSAAGLVATTEVTSGCAPSGEEDDAEGNEDAITLRGYEYVIVGSGAGGGPLAANLARAGHKVLLLEAGDDQGANINEQVPAFHAKSTEDPSMRWDYFVKHYSDEARAAKDSKMTWETPDGEQYVGTNPPPGSKQKGILYPRAGTLGGCTTHNAMLTVYPHESDWQKIADLTGDDSWRPDNMRRYYEILERCEYLRTSDDPRGHGTKGWLGVNRADPRAAGLDLKLVEIFKAAAQVVGGNVIEDFQQLLGLMSRDLNAPGRERDAKEDVYSIPLAISGGKRNGPREFMLDTVRKGYPLTIKTGCLATRVLFAERPGPDGKLKAIGVEFLQGKHLYRADPNASSSGAQGEKHRALASREVILSAGAYNTPQLLKLSGVGPKEELAKLGITVKIDLPGVGTNLQDRYEVGVVSRVKDDFSSLDKCTFGKTPDDPCLVDWRNGKGVYTTNGAPIGLIKKSRVAEGDPDLFIFGGPAYFKGYYPGYSAKATEDKRHFVWAILKGHTRNRAGTVTLRSADPRDVPEINFRYFDEGDGGDKDLEAVAHGVEVARAIGEQAGHNMFDWLPLGVGGQFTEEVPGPAVKTSAQIKEFIKNEAWGHHASCTCPIGKDGDPMAVLDSRFRVRGTTGLRVVDASVFPQIPGFFIVVPIYMVSEKATDVILEDIGERRRVG